MNCETDHFKNRELLVDRCFVDVYIIYNNVEDEVYWILDCITFVTLFFCVYVFYTQYHQYQYSQFIWKLRRKTRKTHNGRGENLSLLQIQRAALALFIGSDDLSYKAPFGSVLVEAKGGLEVGWKLAQG